MSEIQRKSLYCVVVTENKGKGFIVGKRDFHDMMIAYPVANDEKQAKEIAIKSLLNAGLLNDVKKIINVHVEIEHELVVLEV